MSFVISYNGENKYDDVRAFLHIFNAQTGAPVTLMTSDFINIYEKETTLEVDVSYFAEGIYYFELGAMRILPDGSHMTLDRTKTKVYFQIMRSGEGDLPEWSNSIYGSTIMPRIRSV